jgi:hypothetical protein
MKTILFLVALTISTLTFAKSYQVTGPVLDVTPSTITVDKKGEKFEIERTAAMGTDVKKGDKVTVQYSMSATNIEVKSSEKNTKK